MFKVTIQGASWVLWALGRHVGSGPGAENAEGCAESGKVCPGRASRVPMVEGLAWGWESNCLLYVSLWFFMVWANSNAIKINQGKVGKEITKLFWKARRTSQIFHDRWLGCSKIAAGVHEWSQGYQLDLSSPGRVKSPVVVIESFFWSQVTGLMRLL